MRSAAGRAQGGGTRRRLEEPPEGEGVQRCAAVRNDRVSAPNRVALATW